jgi:RNA polymerase sigma factor (sigma-70 family)
VRLIDKPNPIIVYDPVCWNVALAEAKKAYKVDPEDATQEALLGLVEAAHKLHDSTTVTGKEVLTVKYCAMKRVRAYVAEFSGGVVSVAPRSFYRSNRVSTAYGGSEEIDLIDPETSLLGKESDTFVLDKINTLDKNLSTRERYIFKNRVWTVYKISLKKLAKRYKVSEVRIFQIEQDIIQKLKDLFHV